MKIFLGIIGWVIGLTVLTSCVEDNKDIPKPFGYFRIELPDHKYIPYSDTLCPFSFDIPASAMLIDNNQQGQQCFKSLIYPDLKAGVYFTYFPVNDNVAKLIKTADDIVYEHHNMASGIKPVELNQPDKNVYGVSYQLMGEVAVNYVFYLTDSNNHYLAGKLYFETHPNYDSLQPCIDYIAEDIQHLASTLEWK